MWLIEFAAGAFIVWMLLPAFWAFLELVLKPSAKVAKNG